LGVRKLHKELRKASRGLEKGKLSKKAKVALIERMVRTERKLNALNARVKMLKTQRNRIPEEIKREEEIYQLEDPYGEYPDRRTKHQKRLKALKRKEHELNGKIGSLGLQIQRLDLALKELKGEL